jgi:hypothetical protein
MKIRKYWGALLEDTRNITESSVKIGSGTDTGIFSYRINGAREFGEIVINGVPSWRPNTAHIDPESPKNTHFILLFVISDNLPKNIGCYCTVSGYFRGAPIT